MKPSYHDLETENKRLKEKINFLKNQLLSTKETISPESNYFEQLFRNSSSIMFIIDSETMTIVDANEAAYRFYGYSKQEFKGRKISSINQSTEEEIKGHIKEAEKGSQNHFFFKHRLKNGEIKDVEVYSGMINLQNRTVLLSIIHDVSYTVKMENLLKESEEKFKEIFNRAQDPISLTNVSTQKYTDINSAFTEVTGYTKNEVIGKSAFELNLWVSLTDKDRLLDKLLHDGEVNNFITSFRMKSGKILSALVSGKIIKLNGELVMLMMARDVTKWIEIQNNLRESEEKFKKAFISSPDSITLSKWDDGTFTEVNEGFTEISGYKADEVIGKSAIDLNIWVDPIKRIELQEKIKRNNWVRNYNVSFKLKDGTIERGMISAGKIEWKGEKYLISSFRSIEQFLKSEEKAQNLNRVYRVLTFVNKTIVRSTDKSKLFKEICRITVKEGGFSLAWIGKLNKDTGNVNVETFYGKPNDYVKNLKINIYNEKMQKGPTAKAFITGEHSISNNIHKDDFMEPWKNIAYVAGFHSSISLPIILKGKVIYTLNLYSDKKYFFDKKEIELLSSLSMDLAFALSYIEQKNEKVKYEKSLIESEKRYREMIENLNEMVGIHDIDGRILSANKATTKSLGYSEKELLKMKIKEILHPKYKDQYETYINNIKEKGETKGLMSLITKNGENRIWEYHDSLAYDTDTGKRIIRGFAIDVTERIKAEKALKDSEEYYRLLFDLSPSGIVLLDDNGKILKVNRTFCLYMGYESFELVNHYIWEFSALGSKTKENVAEDIEKLKQGDVMEQEVVNVKKDGSLVYLRLHDSMIPSGNGSHKILSVSLNISEEKEMQQQLLRRQDQLKEAQNIGQIGSWEMNWKNKKLEWSDELYNIFGLNPMEVKADYNLFQRFIHPDDLSKARKVLRASISGQQSYKYTHRLLLPGNILKWVVERGRTFYDEEGNPIRSVGTVQDITKQHSADETLRQQTILLKAIAKNYPNSIVAVFDEEKKLEYMNGELIQKLEIDPEKMKGSFISDILKPFSEKKFKQKLMRRFNLAYSGKSNEGEIQYKKYSFYVSFIPIIYENEEVSKILVVMENITKQKDTEKKLLNLNENLENIVHERTVKLESSKKELASSLLEMKEAREKLSQTNKQLKHLNQELEAFAYSVSHDLKAPLRAIHGFSEFLKEDYYDRLNEDGQKLLDDIISNAETMAQLIDGLLRLSRAGRKDLEIIRFDPQPVIYSVFEEQKQLMNLPNAKLIVKSLPHLEMDYTLFKQMMVNLISNALKYSSKKEKQNVEVGTIEIDNKLVFYVKDNGVGFDPQYAGRMFDTFHRLHSQQEFEGTGIGLAIVKRIVTRHEGKIWADAVPNEGATVYFTLS